MFTLLCDDIARQVPPVDTSYCVNFAKQLSSVDTFTWWHYCIMLLSNSLVLIWIDVLPFS